MRKTTLSEMCRLSRGRGGRCISRRYVDSRTHLHWRCRLGHQWKATPTNVTRGSWCPECAHRKLLTIAEMHALARGRGGECLSDRYINSKTKLSWRCAAGHQWRATPGLVKGGRWCAECAHVTRLALNAVATIAASRGGHCLATEYLNAKTPLLWRCKEGHQWTAIPASVRGGKWCALCAHNRRLELHAMQRLAEQRSGMCLSTGYINNSHPLLWECGRGHRWNASAANVKGGTRKRGTWCPECYNLRRRFHERASIESMRDLASSRGGLCLSEEYMNSKSKLLWQCGKGHRWHAVPVAIRRGSWCPVCAGNLKLTLEEFHSLAICRGGKCLSGHYVNKETALRWQCALGHQWHACPGKVKQGAWCPRCANERRRSPWKSLVNDKGGRKLSKHTLEKCGKHSRTSESASFENEMLCTS
jgi:hypothetical protein